MSEAGGNRLDELLRRVQALTGVAPRSDGNEGSSPPSGASPASGAMRPRSGSTPSHPVSRDWQRTPPRSATSSVTESAAAAPSPAATGDSTDAPPRPPVAPPEVTPDPDAVFRSLDARILRGGPLLGGPAGQSRVAGVRRAGRPVTSGLSREPEDPPRFHDEPEAFVPVEPTSLAESGVSEGELEAIILRYLLVRGEASGRQIAEQVRLPLTIVDEFLRSLKSQNLIGYRGMASMNDPVCILSDVGRERARRYNATCTYFGSATVGLATYIESVTRQSIQRQHPSREDLKRAFADLLISDNMMRRLGPAVNSGRGMFLFGAPGNGKTSIAERVTAAFGETIWVPRAINVDGQIMRLFDPASHEEMSLPTGDGLLSTISIDQRWVRIRRPTIIAGGELTMDSLEVSTTAGTGVCEAPLQMKSNCGTLVIDDFGRQTMSVDQLLNRWIVPLEKRYDFLNMPGGKKIQVPFDQLIIFSTNLEPKDLCDDAFLRRIPYKIEVIDPTETEFRRLFEIMAPKMGFVFDGAVIDDLIARHYKPIGRPYRCCQPRDLLLQVRNLCRFENRPLEMTREAFDAAVENYFAIM